MKTFNVIKRPLLTEKSTKNKDENNQYCFQVDVKATKHNIKNAIEQMFKVKVDSVRTMQYHGKRKRVGKSVGMTSMWKKAIVKLKTGKIEFFDGI